MAYAIVVRYHGPTTAHGGRWVATGPAPHLRDIICEHGRKPVNVGPDPRPIRATVGYDDDNGRSAAVAVADKLNAHGWRVTVALGDGYALPDGSGYVFPLAHDSGAY